MAMRALQVVYSGHYFVFSSHQHGEFSDVPTVVALAVEDALASSLVLPLEMLRAGAQHARAHGRSAADLRVQVAGEHDITLVMSGIVKLRPELLVDEVHQADLLIVPSLWRRPAATVARHPRSCAMLRRMARGGTRLCSVGTGTYFPAAAGLLEQRAATTHWSFFDDFSRRFPAVQLQRHHLITHSGAFYCAASVNSAADLMIHFIREFFGAAAAQQVESQFSPEIRRPFEAHGFVEGGTGSHPDELIWMAQDLMLTHLASPLRMPDLAERCGLSTRSFNRRFRAAVGRSPLAYLRSIRLDSARELLRQSNLGIGDIAQRCGYHELSHFSRDFARANGSSPQRFRQRARGKLFSAEPQPKA
jgi:transcriptional regulator GlxA family with amidase domain